MNNKNIQHQKINSPPNLDYENVGELFSEKVKNNPNKTFLIVHGEVIEQFTYLEFKNMVDKTIKFLLKMNLKKNDRISIIFHNSTDFLLLYFAGLCSGLTLVPINPDMASREIEYIIKDSNSKAIFYTNMIETKIDSIQKKMSEKVFLKTTTISELIRTTNYQTNYELEKINLEDIGEIIYTSGTTGNPKGVILSHLNLLSDAMSISKWFQFNEKTRCLCMLPLFHNNGQITTLLAPLYSGSSTVVVRGKTNLFAFWFLINEYQITWTSLMSSILSVLLSFPEERKDDSLTGILCGGQILTRSVQEQFENKFHVPIFEGYGLTETTSFSCINGYPSEKRKLGSIGKPLSTNEMIILNEDDTKTAGDKEGEICIRGYNVAVGYVGDDNMNKAFAKGWFHSGDYGRRDKDGYFYFHGRQDSLIIKGGENIYPAEIENILYTHPAIDECAVIGIPDKLLGENICAFIKIKDTVKLSEKELKIFCRDKIAYFKQPKKFIIINELDTITEIPKGPTKKILYRKLKEYYKNFC